MPAPGFITDAALLAHVQAVLAVAQLDTNTPWTGLTHYANLTAYRQIQAALTRRGFSAAQVDTWDDGAQYQLDLGLYWSLVKGGLTKDYDDKFIKDLDRRKELTTAFVTAAGVALKPATSRIARGDMAQPTVDVFNLTDRDLWDWQRAALGDNGAGTGGPLWPGQNNINQSV